MAWNKENNSRKSYYKKTEKAQYKPKRGKLAPLMKEEDKQKAGIPELSYDFGCRMVRLYQYLTDPVQGSGFKVNVFSEDNRDPLIVNREPVHEREYIMSKKLLRSGTSVGANVRESKHAQSDNDFLSKMSIAYKEADESDYWLNLLHDNGYLNEEQFDSLSHDCTRIVKILTSIVKTMCEKVDSKSNK